MSIIPYLLHYDSLPDRSKDVFVLKLDEDINEDEERHLLLLKNFCLGLNAIEGLQGCEKLSSPDFFSPPGL